MSVTEFAALIGAITGPSGLLLALLVFLRDRAIVDVTAASDMEGYGSMLDSGATYYIVSVTNVGRRTAYVSHMHIALPKGKVPGTSHILLGSLQGVTLPEGSPPHIEMIKQNGLEKYAKVWRRMRATVIDASGKRFHSDWPVTPPSWAANEKAPFGMIIWNRLFNWGRKRII